MNDRIPAPTAEEWEAMLKQARDAGAIPLEFAQRISENFKESKQGPLVDLGEYKEPSPTPLIHTASRAAADLLTKKAEEDLRRWNRTDETRRLRIRDARRDMLFGLMMAFLQTLILVWTLVNGRESPFVWILWVGAALWTGMFIVQARKWWRVRK